MRFITLHSFSLRLPSGSPFASPLRLPLSRALLTFAFDNIFISLLFSRPRCFHCNLINIAANSIHFRAPSPSPSYSLTYAFPRIFLAVSQPAMFRCIGRRSLDGPRQIFLRDSQNRYFYTGSSRGISRTRHRNGDTLSFVPVTLSRRQCIQQRWRKLFPVLSARPPSRRPFSSDSFSFSLFLSLTPFSFMSCRKVSFYNHVNSV